MTIENCDAIDKTILALLQENAHITIKEIAAKVNMSMTPIHERVKKLEQEGIIDRYVTVLNKDKLGKSLIVYCNIRLQNQSPEDFEIFDKAINNLPEVVESCVVSGSFDYFLKIVVSDMKDYYAFHQNKLASIMPVAQINSFFVMHEAKYTTAIPIN